MGKWFSCLLTIVLMVPLLGLAIDGQGDDDHPECHHGILGDCGVIDVDASALPPLAGEAFGWWARSVAPAMSDSPETPPPRRFA